MNKIKVCAGSPGGKLPVCNEFFDAFGGLILPPNSIWRRAIGGSITANLNKLVDEALAEKCSHLFIVEDDSIFPRDTVQRLLKHNKPVVTGLCRSRVPPFRPYIYKGMSEDGLSWYNLTPEDKGLIKCDATGMGGILINTKVFKKLTRPYFRLEYMGEKEFGQDIVFGMSLVKAGIEVYCDTDIEIGHITQCVMGSQHDEDGWKVTMGVSGMKVNFEQPELT